MSLISKLSSHPTWPPYSTAWNSSEPPLEFPFNTLKPFVGRPWNFLEEHRNFNQGVDFGSHEPVPVRVAELTGHRYFSMGWEKYRKVEYVQRRVCFINVQLSLPENVVFYVCARMGNAACIIFIMGNSISGLDAWYYFWFNVSCGVAVKVKSHQTKNQVIL